MDVPLDALDGFLELCGSVDLKKKMPLRIGSM
jgi:hypothetical protein